MGTPRCDVCLGEDGPVSTFPQLSTLLNELLGIKAAEGVASCDACSQLLKLWDEFSREARTNLGGGPHCVEPQCDTKDLEKNIENQSNDNLPAELGVNFTRHFQGICDMCNTTFKNIEAFNEHLNCMHSQHNFILFTNNHIIEDSNENQLKIVQFKKRSMYKKCYSCVYLCNTCNKTFSSKHKLEIHINSDHGCDNSSNPFRNKSCDICVNDLDAGKNIIEHLMESHIEQSNEKLKCPICDVLFNSKDDIEYHIDSCHFKIKMKFRCDLPCKKIVLSKKKLDYHVNKIHLHKISFLTCDYCSKKFKKKFNLRNHIVANHLPSRNIKKQVNEIIIPITPDSSKINPILGQPLITPIVRNTPANVSCTLCNKSFKSLAQLNMHSKTVHSPRAVNFTCGICQKSFIEDSELSSHIIQEHQSSGLTNVVNSLKRKNDSESISVNVNKSKLFKIDRNYTAATVDKYDYFQEDGAYYCSFCHKITALEMAMKLHLKKFHKLDKPVIKSDDTVSESQQSDDGAEENKSNNNLESNINNVSESNDMEIENNDENIIDNAASSNVKCNLCSEILASSEEYIEHLKTHVRNKGIAALFTPKSPVEINSNVSLKLDKLETPVEVPVEVPEILLSCNKCNEKFHKDNDLINHEPRCTNNASEFMCKLCSKSFTTKLGLSVHNQVHSGKDAKLVNSSSNLTCEICNKTVATKHGLVLHKKYAHAQQGSSNDMGETSKNSSTVGIEASIFVCKFCDQSLPDEGEFKQHLMDHVKRLS